MQTQDSTADYEFFEAPPARNWTNGAWRDAEGATIPVINPRHGRAMSSVGMSSADDVDAAIASAQQAVSAWSDRPIRERAKVFYRLRELMSRDLEELGY